MPLHGAAGGGRWMSLGILVLGALAAFFAGISKGGFGSGAAFAGVSILALAVPPGAALGIMLPLLMLIDLACLGPYWRRWRGREALLLLCGGLPGVGLGVLFYRAADADLLRLMIGALALTFVAWQLSARWRARAGRPGPARGREAAPALGVAAGVVAGFTSFVSHAGGPPVAAYLLARGLDKTAFQATTVLVFWLLNIAKALPYGLLGLFGADSLLMALVLSPVALAGTWVGVRAHRLVPERRFFAVTYVLLVVTGGKLIWDGLG